MKNPIELQAMVRRRVRRRRAWRRLRILALVLVVIAALSAAAFGVSRGVAYGRKLWDEHHRSTTTTTQATTAATSSTTTTFAGPPRCTTAELAAYMFSWRITDNVLYEVVQLHSNSPAPCTLLGFPTLGALDTAGAALPAPNHPLASLGATPGAPAAAPAPVVLSTVGATAWFELAFATNCSQTLTSGPPPAGSTGACYAGAQLAITPPAAVTPLVIAQPLPFNYSTNGILVGPFLAGAAPGSPPVGL